MTKPIRVVALLAVVGLALTACSGGSAGNSGSGGRTLIISSDLPLLGSSKDASESTNNAIRLYLEQVGNKAGKYNVKFETYDDSTTTTGKWESGKCQQNATAHVQKKDEVAVMGTYNSGCAKIILPILNQAPDGPMLMVSHANTNPGLTKTWEKGEPEKFYPKGTRNYARVVTTDDIQGQAAAKFMVESLGVRKVYILNDNETYGQGVAKQFEESAKAAGVTVLGNESWEAKATNYVALFQKIKASGAEAVYLGGIFDSNGGQLIKDKVAVLGKNSVVKFMAPDGFTGYPTLTKLAEAQGMYLTFPGLTTSELRSSGGTGAKLLDAYKVKHGTDPVSNYALYGVAGVQVILAAIEKSDGTRRSITEQVFSGDGITIPANLSVLGKEMKIDPKSGDVNVKDITVEVVKGSKEVPLKSIALS
ncbi:MAG: branched-chain amino acid transport system substrate-binding protein [Actinomycetota bacterium]|nr:branched-chain amino acid transport system substrate-binding protein [Actinomycetota bacterium]